MLFTRKDPAGDGTDDDCSGCGGEKDMEGVQQKSITKTADTVETRQVSGEERDVISVTISSTSKDRDGDRFSEDGLKSMRDQIKRERPLVFLNHGFTDFASPLYDARDTIGTQIDAEIDDETLVAYILPDLTHDEGRRMLEQAEGGQAIKFSVGFRIYQADEVDESESDDPDMVFHEVDLMETSKVGIPAQPDATVQAAMKSVGLTESLSQSGVEINDEEAFAAALASELVSRDGPITSEDVRDATPVQIDGSPVNVERDADETKPKCDSDEDCPDGQVCQDGHCVDEDEADDSSTNDMTTQKAPGDVSSEDWAELISAHYEGAETEDLLEAWEPWDYVGEASVSEVSAFVADMVDQSQDDVEDQFDDWLASTEDEDDDDEDDGDDEDEEESAEGDSEESVEEQDGEDPADEELESLRQEVSDLRERVEESETADSKTVSEGDAEEQDGDSGETKSLQETVHQ